MNPYLLCPDFKLGLTFAGMLRLPYLGIPDPVQATFNDYPVRNVRGNGLTSGHGFPVAVWRWPNGMTREAWLSLIAFITGAGSTVYVRTRTNGAATFANYTAAIVRPSVAGDEGAPAEWHGSGYTPLTLTLNRLQVYP
jgi:hypothetical protein